MDKNADKSVMYDSEEVERTLNDDFLTDALRGARKRELELLQQELLRLHDEVRTPLRILDIGIGDGHVPLSFKKDLLDVIESYVGIDNSPRELEQCEKNIAKAGLETLIKLHELDAVNLGDDTARNRLGLPFHAVVCTYFTPGNFRPDEITFEEDETGHIKPYSTEVLKPNKKFQKVFSGAYEMLADGGRLILGATYIDSEATRLKQEEFYKKCGMQVITTEKDSFTATRQGFWSQRFTEDKLYSYLDWVDREQIAFVPLDNENFARMVVITKVNQS